MDKVKEFDKLISQMAKCDKCLKMKSRNGIDCSLVNIYKDEEFSKNMPSIWTDWYNRLDSKIMVIGQDWGPYNDMEKYHKEYIKSKTKENWKRIIKQEKSMTKKMLTKYLIESANNNNVNKTENILDELYITNAIMCARKGNNYRGNNIKLKESTIGCMENIKSQIEIVKPKIILTLGYFPLYSLSSIYNFKIDKNLTLTVKNNGEFNIDDFVIIPLFHPTAQIKREEQLKQYNKIWKYI